MIYTDDNYILATLKKRAIDAHKGDFGKVLIFAGSVGMAGAAVLCGRAALRTGSGLVRFLLPDFSGPLLPILQTAVPEATCVCYSEDPDYNEYDAIACGPGIGQDETARKILESILSGCGKTLLLDADALNLVSTHDDLAELVRSSPASIIITPHPGEAKRLLHSCAGIAGLSGRKNAVCDLAERYRCTAILKGAGTLVAAKTEDAGLQVYENTTGNPGMATGGSGDTLSGIIASLAGQGYLPLDAARLGVFLHGKAGDLAAADLGEMSVTASDIGDYIAAALKIYYCA